MYDILLKTEEVLDATGKVIALVSTFKTNGTREEWEAQQAAEHEATRQRWQKFWLDQEERILRGIRETV